jgi:oxygen-dependent protoporphyrinogen oxidase
MTDVECVVIGAGIAGLAAAATLRRQGREVIALEARARAGGSAWSERIDGHLVERGPNTFRIPPAMAAFAGEHGLASRLQKAQPASRERFLLRAGRLVPVPMSAFAFARTPLLTRGGKLRLLAEPFQRGGDPTGESVAEFATRRLGCEACDALIAPFLTGVYAGDENQLGAEAVFPTLVAAERNSGSIIRGLLANALRGAGSKGSWGGTWSAANGISALTDALAVSLDGALRLGARASSITFEDGSYRFEIEEESGFQTLRSKALVLALPAQSAAGLLGALDRDAAEAIGAIESAPVASVAISIASDATRVPLRGFGYLVPRGEGELLLGCLFSSQLFAGRAPPGREVLTLLAVGKRKPEAIDWSDEKLVAALLAEIEPVLGLRDAPRVLSITRWPRAVAQPGRDHPRLVAGARAQLAHFPRLALAGSHLDGVAFGEALASGARAAQQVMEER